ncbi:MAG: hypothetical protein Kow0068_03090 [Marinilabiliales bacterium]
MIVFKQHQPKKISFLNNNVESEKENATEAIKWLNERRLNLQTNSINPQDIINAKKAVDKLKKTSSKQNLNLFWEERGPDNIGGRTRAILVDKNNPNIIYAGGVSGGLWKSTTGGLSWHAVNDNEENLAVVSICQAANGDIYFGTGEGMYSPSGTGTGGIAGQGIWKSTDGNTFTHLSSTWDTPSSQNTFINVNKLAADPVNPNRIYAATKGGLMVSNDAGETWTNATSSTAASSDVKVGSDGSVIASIGNRAYRSSNGDAGTFTKNPMGSDQITYYASRIEFAIAPSNPEIIYCLAYIYGTSILYISEDKGETWEAIADGTQSESFNPLGDQGTYDNVIAVYPDNPYKIIFGGQLALWKGTKNSFGWSFEQISWWSLDPSSSYYVHADHHAIVFHPNNPDIIYIGCDGGISRSLDGGNTFHTLNNNYSVTQFYGIGFSGQDHLVGGTQDNGSLFITPYAFTNKSAIELSGGDGGQSEISMLNPDIIYTTIYGAQVYQTISGHGTEFIFAPQNGGPFVTPLALWESFNDTYSTDTLTFLAQQYYPAGTVLNLVSKYNNLTVPVTLSSPLYEGDTLYAIDPYQSMLAVGINGGVAVSRNVGYKSYSADWYQISISGSINELEFSKAGDILYAANYNTIYRISNLLQARDDSTFQNVEVLAIGSFNGRTITDIAVDPQNKENVIVTLGNYGNTNYVYYSNNAASTTTSSGNFVAKQGNLPAMPVYSAVINWDNSDEVIIGTEFGVFSTLSISSTSPVWASDNNGLPNVPVFMLRQQTFENFWLEGNKGVSNHGYLYAGTHGRGIFSSKTLKGPLAINEPKSNDYSQHILIYPNPADNFINISIPQDESVEIMIVNTNGQVVKQIINDKKSIYTINVNSLENGVYYCIIKGKNWKKTEKVIIL